MEPTNEEFVRGDLEDRGLIVEKDGQLGRPDFKVFLGDELKFQVEVKDADSLFTPLQIEWMLKQTPPDWAKYLLAIPLTGGGTFEIAYLRVESMRAWTTPEHEIGKTTVEIQDADSRLRVLIRRADAKAEELRRIEAQLLQFKEDMDSAHDEAARWVSCNVDRFARILSQQLRGTESGEKWIAMLKSTLMKELKTAEVERHAIGT